MHRSNQIAEETVLRIGAGVAGVMLTASAALAADLARDHMTLIGTICGAGPHPHCGWCFGAAGLAMAGLAAFAVAIRPSLSLIKVKLAER